MDVHPERSSAHSPTLPPTNVRVLHGEQELAEAIARAAESAKKLHDRLVNRAARDASMAERAEQRVGWLRFARGAAGDVPLVTDADHPEKRESSPRRAASSSAA